MIKIEKLSLSYGNNLVLNELDISFSEGNIYGVVGENGAGKTSFFRCIAGLESYEGNIQSELLPLKNHLGLLLTEPFFPAKITGKEYINLLCEARNVHVEVNENNNIFGLPLNQYASNYSTGMKKKLALTAILLQQNKVFILDEPYNGLDIESNILLNELILKLRDLNKLVLLSSHIFSTLREVCHQIIFLRKGFQPEIYSQGEFDSLEREMKPTNLSEKLMRIKLS
jgi:ABC-2 type transport system ATP-binding protein